MLILNHYNFSKGVYYKMVIIQMYLPNRKRIVNKTLIVPLVSNTFTLGSFSLVEAPLKFFFYFGVKLHYCISFNVLNSLTMEWIFNLLKEKKLHRSMTVEYGGYRTCTILCSKSILFKEKSCTEHDLVSMEGAVLVQTYVLQKRKNPVSIYFHNTL